MPASLETPVHPSTPNVTLVISYTCISKHPHTRGRKRALKVLLFSFNLLYRQFMFYHIFQVYSRPSALLEPVPSVLSSAMCFSGATQDTHFLPFSSLAWQTSAKLALGFPCTPQVLAPFSRSTPEKRAGST